MAASRITGGILLRSINKAGRVRGCGFSPKVIGAWLKRKQRSVRFQDWRPMTCAGPVPVSVIKQAVSWSKYNFSWDMSLCKPPSGTSDAKRASTTPLMIGSGRTGSAGIFVDSASLADFRTYRRFRTWKWHRERRSPFRKADYSLLWISRRNAPIDILGPCGPSGRQSRPIALTELSRLHPAETIWFGKGSWPTERQTAAFSGR